MLVVVNSFSKWIEAYPVPNIEAKTITEKLVLKFISLFGIPLQIKSDRGKQFELFRAMCELLDVDHKMSSPFHPHGTHELVEDVIFQVPARLNKTTKKVT